MHLSFDFQYILYMKNESDSCRLQKSQMLVVLPKLLSYNIILVSFIPIDNIILSDILSGIYFSTLLNVLINFSVKLLCILLFLSSNSICFEDEETFCDAYSLDIYLIGKYGTPFILSTLSFTKLINKYSDNTELTYTSVIFSG